MLSLSLSGALVDDHFIKHSSSLVRPFVSHTKQGVVLNPVANVFDIGSRQWDVWWNGLPVL